MLADYRNAAPIAILLSLVLVVPLEGTQRLVDDATVITRSSDACPFPNSTPGQSSGIAHPSDEPAVIRADKVKLDNDGKRELIGNASIRYGSTVVTSDQIQVDSQNQRAVFDHGFTAVTPNVIFRAQTAQIDYTSESFNVTEAEYVLPGLKSHGLANFLTKSNSDVTATDITYTGCFEVNPAWHLAIREFRQSPQRFVAKGVRIHLGKLPVFYTPYLRLSRELGPDSKRHGFILPKLDYRSSLGATVGLPIAFRLHELVAVEVTPQRLTRRGTGLDLAINSGTSKVKVEWLANDRLFDGIRYRDEYEILALDESFSPAPRWLVATSHKHAGVSWVGELDYQATSDYRYHSDFGANLDETSKVATVSSARLNYEKRDWIAELSFQHFESTITEGVSRDVLPQLNLRWTPTIKNLRLESDLSYSKMGSDEPNSIYFNSLRTHVSQSFEYFLQKPWGELAFKRGYAETNFDLNEFSEVSQAVARRVHSSSIKGELLLDKFDSSWQTLVPTIYYLNRTASDQQALPNFDNGQWILGWDSIFSERRQTGLDRTPDADSLSVGFTHFLRDSRRGTQNSHLELAWIHHFDETIKDQIAIGIKLRTSSRWSLRHQQIWQTGGGYRNEFNIFLETHLLDGGVLNLGYGYRPSTDIDQSVVSFYVPVSTKWHVFGSWNYDWERGQNIEGFAGFGYDDCCIGVRLLMRNALKPKRYLNQAEANQNFGVKIQLTLKGLGGLGRSVQDFLADRIRGFQRN